MSSRGAEDTFQDIVIGSGFGGAMVAHRLVAAGRRVLMLERGDWPVRGEAARDDVRGFFQWTAGYGSATSYRVRQGGRWGVEGICECVGGASVFYGGASFRFREADFRPPASLVESSGAEWPLGYADLEASYAEAERLLGVAGEAGVDPTEPPRSGPYPCAPAPLAPVAARVGAAASRLGLHPFRIPLAVNHSAGGVAVCTSCTTCDAYACWNGAKNDLASRIIAPLLQRGLELRCGRVVTRLIAEGTRVTKVECVDRVTGVRERYSGERVILAAGALATPHLLLASGLERLNPAGDAVGRFLMRHCNAFVYGFFRRPPNPERLHHKQLAIHDFYFGDPGGGGPAGKLGNIQQIMAPQTGAALRWTRRLGERGRPLQNVAAAAVRGVTRHMTGLQVIAEDQPSARNRVELGEGRDEFGLPKPVVHHDYSARDLAARAALVRRAREILREAGAFATFTYPVTTFSHAVGTVRMGGDSALAPLDAHCRFRGVENLWVVDGSCLPTSGGVNPSLTIAALALRAGESLTSGTERQTA
jgi:choline dehydrogenase-like flavoprotein